MKRLMRKFEDLMVAITFAEAGEYDTCKEILDTAAGKDEAAAPNATPQPETVTGRPKDFS